MKQKEPIASFNVRGVTFEGRKEKLITLLGEQRSVKYPACLIPDPANPYDSNAIAVYTRKPDMHIGFVPKEICGVILCAIKEKVLSQHGHEVSINKGIGDRGEEIVWARFNIQEMNHSRKNLVGKERK